MPIPTAELLRRVLAAAGIDAVYGAPFGRLAVTPVPDAVAETFALAHHRVYGARAGVHAGAGRFRFPGSGSAHPPVRQVDTADDVVAGVAALADGAAVELQLTLQPDEPVPDVVPWVPPAAAWWVDPAPEVVEALREAQTVVVLAGPGVVRQAAVPGLHDLAVKADVGVLNTWGAKGVFDWRSRHHLATVGLQQHDFALGGLADVDLIIATGLDPLESPGARWRLAPSFDVAPGALAPLAEHCRAVPGAIGVPPIRTRLADVTQRGWEVSHSPLPPTRVTLHYAECVAAGALVAADAGAAGFWVARTVGTTRLGGVIVPSAPLPGFAAACVAVARLRRPYRPAVAVVDVATAEETAAVVEAAGRLGVPVPVEVWDPDGDRLDAAAHQARLRQLIGSPDAAPGAATLATGAGQLAQMLEAAGAIVAWTADQPGESR